MSIEVHFIKADPGYFACDRRYADYDSSKGFFVELMPIIAWKMEVDFYKLDENQRYLTTVEPICTDALTSHFKGAVMQPDGRVIRREMQEWPSVETYAAELGALGVIRH